MAEKKEKEERIFGFTREELLKVMRQKNYPQVEYERQHKIYTKNKATNKELCKKCGGACCKTCGCQFSPEDFKEVNFDSLYHEIEKGYIAFDVFDDADWRGDTFVYYLRVRNKGESLCDSLRPILRKKQGCILLTKRGCKLTYENRPTGGRNLLPIYDHDHHLNCHQTYDTVECAHEWLPYKELLGQLIQVFRDRDIECTI